MSIITILCVFEIVGEQCKTNDLYRQVYEVRHLTPEPQWCNKNNKIR